MPPYNFISQILKDYDDNNNFLIKKSFKKYVLCEINRIEEKLGLEKKNHKIPNDFNTTLKKSFKQLYIDRQDIKLNEKDEEEIIQKLYNLNYQLKNNSFSHTKYSLSFFDILIKAIKNSEKLQKENLKKSLLDFFSYTDQLFQKELKEEDELEKSQIRQNYKKIKEETEPKINKLFDESNQKLNNIFDQGKEKSINEIEEEICNIEERLKEVNKNIEKASTKIQKKIEEIISKVGDSQKKELNSLLNKIQKLIAIKFNEEKTPKNEASTEIDTNIGLGAKMVSSFISSILSGFFVRTGLIYIGESILATSITSSSISTIIAGGLVTGFGTGIGVGVGLVIPIITFLYNYFSKERRYKEGLEKYKKDIEKIFEESKQNCLNDFNLYRSYISNNIYIKIQIMVKKINTVDDKKWEEIKQNYKIKKKIIMTKINSIKMN